MSFYISAVLCLVMLGSSAVAQVRWCTHNAPEKRKCDAWSSVSGEAITCIAALSVEHCVQLILADKADAVTLHAGRLHLAVCSGLVPVMAEYYNKDNLKPCKTQHNQDDLLKDTYYIVAVVMKKNKAISWDALRGIDFPSYDITENLCRLYRNDHLKKPSTESHIVCTSGDKENHQDFTAAFRCLVEMGGVAVAKHSTVFENTDGNNLEDWAKDLKCDDFELLCADGSRVPVSEYKKCNIAELPPGIVFTLPQKKHIVGGILKNQQSLYGRNAFQRYIFQMFESTGGHDLLFSDDTKCLVEIGQKITLKEYLGEKYPAVLRI
ncbi:serotransferrin-A-like isoform X1 [Aquarana catesbeiana]|uniref:serotransferrin-A-like isoform X1 n=1 Tax=Aquarana catesbeiana TaxID=8400 RepID=UPI003CCA3BF5